MGKNVHYGSSSFEFQKMRLINWFGSWSKMLLATTATVVAAAVFGFQYAAGLIVAPLLHSRAKKHLGVFTAFLSRPKPDSCWRAAARAEVNDDDLVLLRNTFSNNDSATAATVVASSIPNTLASSANILRRDWLGHAGMATLFTLWGGGVIAPPVCNAAATEDLINVDPLAAFGMQLEQATKDDLVRSVVVVEAQSSQWPRDAAHPLPSNRGLDAAALPLPNAVEPVVPATAAAATATGSGGLLDAIEQARTKKQVNPRTHG
jgi:hypothetical protein